MTDNLDIGSHDGSDGGEGKSFQGADPLDSGSDDDSGGGNGKSPQSADPLDFGAIEGAVNEAAKRLNAVWVTFILSMTYLFIATGKITHKDLFLETPVKLPILNVDVPLVGYFIAAPVFILAVHFYFLIQLHGLAAKFREYDAVLSELATADHPQIERLRHRIDNSLFAQILGGPRSATVVFLRLAAVLTVVILPILLLLFIQLTFLAYQSLGVTKFHRLMITTDVGLIAVYSIAIALSWRRRKSLPSRPGRAWRAGITSIHSGWNFALFISLCFAALSSMLVSWLFAVLPFEPYYFPGRTRAWFETDPDPVHQGPSSWFSNRLVLPDQNLIEGFDLDKAKVTRSLRGRHFVSAIFDRADLRRTDFTGADLSFASFQGAKLEKAQFGCASSDSSAYSCTRLQEARFDSAEIKDGEFFGANMMGASLVFARLDGASLAQAQLQGASLKLARLDGADLSSAAMDGTLLSEGSLVAASLSNASLRGADFSNTQMFGATLDGDLAQDASFENAQMQGASMQRANFSAAKFIKTWVYGADVLGARFKGAFIKDVSDLRSWTFGYGYTSFYPDVFQGDPFGKEEDHISLNDGYTDVWGDSSYTAAIPTSEQDRLRQLFPKGLPQDPSGTEIKKHLARLAPESKTADWTKLTDKTISEDEYIKGLGERLIIIACAKEGEGHVARGLIRNKRLCTYQKEVEATLNSGLLPNGKACADAQTFKQIWNEAMQASTVCQQNAGSPLTK